MMKSNIRAIGSSVQLVALFLLLQSICLADQPSIEAAIEKQSAWTGEAVPMTVKLFSPGPFDGTPAFEIPKLPLTTIMKTPGSPVVQSEKIGNDSWFTQLHEFVIYTQRQGEIVIPRFQVRFEGKRSFTGDAEEMGGTTKELRFQSQRPPGTQELGFVVVASSMEVSQSWTPASEETLNAGDVLQRKITRHAADTTAMMFSPIDTDAPAGVRIYASAPVLQDDTERGAATAERIDTVKYQFLRGGNFILPDITVTWWDAKSSSLEHRTLVGRSVQVLELPQVAAVPDSSSDTRWIWGLSLLILLILLVWIYRKPLVKMLAGWRAKCDQPVKTAAQRVMAACRVNHPTEAYLAIMEWQRAMDNSDPGWPLRMPASDVSKFNEQLTALARLLYADDQPISSWHGKPMADSFDRVCRERSRLGSGRHTQTLPNLNPV